MNMNGKKFMHATCSFFKKKMCFPELTVLTFFDFGS